jgi:putative transposase
MLKINSCPECRSDVMVDKDEHGQYEECLQCNYRRITHQLRHEGWRLNYKKVLTLMRESDLLCRVKLKWVKTTDSKLCFPRYSNLIKRMLISRLNQVWLAHITYIRIGTGLVYLAAILDALSRRVIGYAVSTRGLDTTLTLKALCVAIAVRGPGPGVISSRRPRSTVCLG